MEPAEIKETGQAQQISDLTGLWLVCFSGRDAKKYWWDRFRFTSRDFRHCYVLQYQVHTRRWVLVDWQVGLCDVIVFEHHELDSILAYLQNNYGCAVIVKRRIDERKIHYRIPLLYCVQAVLQVIGLPTRLTFTPRQLYKRLMREGCEELISYRSA